MKSTRIVTLLALAAAAIPAVMAYQNFAQSKAPDVPPELPVQAAKSPISLVEARAFSLAKPTTHTWRLEQPQYDQGLVLVLKVDPTLVHPRQSAEPVLYVGAQTAERVNLGHESGHVVAIVPFVNGAAIDLSVAPIFFGTAELPERIDGMRAAEELAAAIRAGAKAPGADVVGQVTLPAVSFDDDYELKLFCSDLIAQYSPTEADLVNGLRVPRLGQ